MKKPLLKQFRTLAATLPPMIHPNTEVQYRAYAGTAGKKSLGRQLVKYKLSGVPVNHKRRIKRAYQRGGWAAVAKYDAYIRKHTTTATA